MATQADLEGDVIAVARRADDLHALVSDLLRQATPADDDAAAALDRIAASLADVPARCWMEIALLDIVLPGAIARVIRAAVNCTAAGQFSYADANAMLSVFAPMVEAARRRSLN
jgi:hypothetical protein